MPEYLYVFTPGDRPELARDLTAWTEEDLEVLQAHSTHLERGAAEGVIILAGRSQDGIGPSVVIFEAADHAAAEAFMASDPFLTSGLFGARLHPFRAAFMRSD
jgi:uncharacterized protein YciI